MTKTINLTHITQATLRPLAKPVGRYQSRTPHVVRRVNKQAGFKKHGHQASQVICNRNSKYAGAGIIWTTV